MGFFYCRVYDVSIISENEFESLSILHVTPMKGTSLQKNHDCTDATEYSPTQTLSTRE